jgi:hypothetical protein
MKSATCLQPTSRNRGAHPTYITGAAGGKQTPVGLPLLKEVQPVGLDRPDHQVPVQEVVNALTAGLTQVNAAMAGGSVEVAFVVRVVWLLPAWNKYLDTQKLVHERFDRYVPEDLTIKEASRLIDEMKNGTLSERN